MDFTIQIPEAYLATERMGGAILSEANREISIGRNSTNFERLEEFIKDSEGTSYDRLKEKKNLNINGLESMSGFIDNEKIYFIYSEYNVYLLSTKDKTLYSDLDQIAQSFKYTP